MARFHGRVGYGVTVENAPGVYTDGIVEHIHYGDVIRQSRKLTETDILNKGISVGNAISIVADAYAQAHFFDVRYVEWAGQLWSVSEVEVQAPRLILTLGEVYNGPAAED